MTWHCSSLQVIQCGHGKNFSGIHVVDVGLGLWRWIYNGYYILNGSSQCQLHQNALVKIMLSLFIPGLYRDRRFRNVYFGAFLFWNTQRKSTEMNTGGASYIENRQKWLIQMYLGERLNSNQDDQWLTKTAYAFQLLLYFICADRVMEINGFVVWVRIQGIQQMNCWSLGVWFTMNIQTKLESLPFSLTPHPTSRPFW